MNGLCPVVGQDRTGPEKQTATKNKNIQLANKPVEVGDISKDGDVWFVSGGASKRQDPDEQLPVIHSRASAVAQTALLG